jgi:hypothetical protein
MSVIRMRLNGTMAMMAKNDIEAARIDKRSLMNARVLL